MANTVKHPGGASATSLSPPAPAVDTSAWEVVQTFDFTGMSAYTFGDNDTETLDGVDWISRNQTRSSSFQIKATGLEIASGASQTSNRWFSTVQNGPALFADLSDIVSGYDLNDTIVLQALLSSSASTVQDDGNAGSQYIYAGILAGDGGYGNSGGGNWIQSAYYRRLSESTNYYFSRYGGGASAGHGTNYAFSDTGGSAPTFLELVLYPGTGFSTAGSLDADFQDPLTVTGGRFYGNMQTTLPKDIGTGSTTSPGATPDFTLRPANLHCGLTFYYLTTGGSRASEGSATFTKFRVLKRK